MASFEYLLDYVLVEPRLSETYWYFSKEMECCFCYDDLNDSNFNAFKNKLNEKSIVELPRISLDELRINFVESFNIEKVLNYLDLFDNDDKVIGAEKIIFSQNERFYSQNGFFEKFCINNAVPIIMEWGLNNSINITKKNISTYVFTNEDLGNIIVPLDGVSVSKVVNLMTVDNMYFDKRTYSFIDDSEVNKKPYLDCIKLPYIDDYAIYNVYIKSRCRFDFIDSFNNRQEFCVAFRKYIDDNGYSDEFWEFKNEYLIPYVTTWCKINDIRMLSETEFNSSM